MRPRAPAAASQRAGFGAIKIFLKERLVDSGRLRFARCPMYTVVMLDAAGRKISDSPPGYHAQSELVPEHDSIGHMR